MLRVSIFPLKPVRKKKLVSEWTPARVRSFIVSVLRAGSRRWPPKYETLNDAFTERKLNKKTGKLAKHYTCAICQEEFTAKDIEIDHIIPVVSPTKGFTTWDSFISNLFCQKENLQAVCKSCHKEKTARERNVHQDSNSNGKRGSRVSSKSK